MAEMTLPPIRIDVAIAHGSDSIGGPWHPSETECRAAWELTVELTTRVPVIPLRDEEGLLEEALLSLANLFGATRMILRQHGPVVAEHRPGELSFAVLAGLMLNQVVRPVTAYWHPRLSEYVETRPSGTSRAERESVWPEREQLRHVLRSLGQTLSEFAEYFARASSAQEFVRTQIEHEEVLYDEAARRRAQGRTP